jgi:DNA mismatch repair protein MutS
MKSFITDKQTLDDLNIPGKFKSLSIFNIFNRVQTIGGEQLLDEMFRQPLTNPDSINRRSTVFKYFQDKGITFPISKQVFEKAENYLGYGAAGNYPLTAIAVIRQKLMKLMLQDPEYDRLQQGLSATMEVVNAVAGVMEQLSDFPFEEELKDIRQVLADHRLASIRLRSAGAGLSLSNLVRYHYLLGHTLRPAMDRLLQTVYWLDVYVSVSQVARDRSFVYALALPAGENVCEIASVKHPGIVNAVPNDILFDREKNLIFLTGANMAGKSTLMKSFGIAIYLAHMGFPVAAGTMKFSVRDGLFTSINVADNLNMGYSHFYAEVLRVKQVAEMVSAGFKMVVIFDELFKGTNVKDAYDATYAVTKAFLSFRECAFVISTHIIEVGEALEPVAARIRFKYLPTVMTGNIPSYPYLLADGITSDRQGMMIIRNERILELLHK